MTPDAERVGRVMWPDALAPATVPTLYFIGVTTGKSSIQRVFPRWAEYLGLGDAILCGIDVPIHASAQTYRRVVEFIKHDPRSIGALVTTHKIDVYRACADLFDVIGPHAQHMGDVSCLSKVDGQMVCDAMDPISSGLALDAFIPAGHWERTGAEALLLGAGGSTIAISWYLSRPSRGADRPGRSVRSVSRLERLKEIHAELDTDTEFAYVLSPEPADNNRVVDALPSSSLVVNATGLGKDAPGSPLDGSETFPQGGFGWDLNCGGDLVFLDQAHARAEARHLHVEGGWTYFLHGWTQVVAEVFHLPIPTSGPGFDRLSQLAAGARGQGKVGERMGMIGTTPGTSAMEAMEPLVKRIAQLEPQIRASEQKGARVVLTHPETAISYTMAELAKASGVSEPTVMRFCAAVGCDRFLSFKLELAHSVALSMPPTHMTITTSDGTSDLAGKIVDQTISTLYRMRRGLDVSTLDEAVSALLKADDVIFVRFGASDIIAQEAQQTFPLFGIPCQAPADLHQQFIAAAMSSTWSVLFAISNTGHTADVLRVAREANRASATVIGMTGQEGPLQALADMPLFVRTHENTDFYTPTLSRLAGLVVIDIVATAVALGRSREHLERVQAMKIRLATMRQGDNSHE